MNGVYRALVIGWRNRREMIPTSLKNSTGVKASARWFRFCVGGDKDRNLVGDRRVRLRIEGRAARPATILSRFFKAGLRRFLRRADLATAIGEEPRNDSDASQRGDITFRYAEVYAC